MRKIKEILRLRWEQNLPVRTIAHSVGVSHSTVVDMLNRAKAAGLSWPLPDDLDDGQLEARLYPGNREQGRVRPEPDWAAVHRELRRKGVTLQLLWMEYKRQHPDGYQYSRFCQRYAAWAKQLEVVLRQPHQAGETMMVDFAGQTLSIVDPRTGKSWEAPVFVAVLPASNYTFADVAAAQDLENWVVMIVRALHFFGGVAEKLVCDNPKALVVRPCRYEPDLNPTLMELAAHYGMAVLPARVGRATDKGKVENAVLQAERWILAPLRKQAFFSLTEARQAVAAQLEALNNRPFQKLPGTRRSLFETLERPALRPLPSQPYEFARWKQARVNIDYHVEVERSFYSVPYQLCGHQVEVRYNAATVEIFFKGRRVASHRRTREAGKYCTNPEHMPAAHRQYLEWKPSRLIGWARQSVGPHTAALVEAILAAKPHPEQGYRACLGIMRLAQHYERERMENAAQRALAWRALSYTRLKSILEKGLDRRPLEEVQETSLVATHENLRGPHYYGHREACSSC